MTRDEASNILDDYDVNFDGHTAEEIAEAFEVAFRALEQEPCNEELDFVQEHKKISCNLIVEPCEDTISRSDMLDAIGHGTVYTSEDLQKIIKALPPVTPQYTEDEIQKMQDLEQAEIDKSYELGKAEGQKSEGKE
jgi:hypothetical protein